MKTLTEYGQFKEHCTAFAEEFAESYLPEGQLLCHPLIKGLIFAPAEEEEAKKNGPDICRLYDFMLMSENGTDDWKPFNITEARRIASENEHIFLSDLMYETVFMAHDWMIDGKHDQVIVSEQYMREHNKPYAPVTPLTNMRLNFKKIKNDDFWVKGTLESPAFISFNEISDNLDKFSASCLEKFPLISELTEKTFKIGDAQVKISAENVKKMTLISSLKISKELKGEINRVSPMLNALGMKMTPLGYTIKFLVSALGKNGVQLSGADFRINYYEKELEKDSSSERKAAERAFIRAYNEKNTCGYKEVPDNYEEFDKLLTEIETGSLTGKDLLGAVCGLLSNRPENGAAFKLLYANFSEFIPDIQAVEEFWLLKKRSFSDEDLDKYLSNKYIPKDIVNENGEFTCGCEKAKLVYEELKSASDKYRYFSCPCAEKLKAYIDTEEISSRTYNGTVFESVDEMKKAVLNESKLSDMCVDMSALNRDEIKKLKKYIYDTTADKKTKAKYLLKVKLAENDVMKNELSQISLKLPISNADEAKQILEKIKVSDADDTVKKPFIDAANDRIFAAQSESFAQKFKNIDKLSLTEIDTLLKDAEKSEASPLVKKHFLKKAEYAKNDLARKDIEEICKDIENSSKEKLNEIKKKVEEKNYPAFISRHELNKISSLIAECDKKEVKEVFGDISKASKETLEKLRNIINEGKYSTELTNPYINKIAERDKAIKLEEFEDRCRKIPEMDKDALAKIKAEFTTGEYPEELTGKYAEKIIAREDELEKNEIAEIAKDIDKSDIIGLDKIKASLSNEKFRKEFTEKYFVQIKERRLAVLTENLDKMTNAELDKLSESLKTNDFEEEKINPYFEKIKQRRDTIQKEEIASLCKDISKLENKDLDELVKKLSDEKYNKEFTSEYFEKIKTRRIEIDNAEVIKLCEGVDKMSRADVKATREKISAEKYNKEFTKSYFEKLDKRDADLDKSELEELTKNIDKLGKPELEKLTSQINEKYKKEISAPFIEKIRAKEISLMKAEMEKLCKNIPSTPRGELSKLKEALKSDEFDKELSAKYIKQIEERENSLIKTELANLCKNIENTPKDKLLEIKLKISETPEYKEPGKEYIEKIDNRLKKLDKEEFDRMMSSIDKMTMEELDKFSEELEKRKPTLEASKYSDTLKLIENRSDALEKAELDELCKNLPEKSIADIKTALDSIEDKGYNQTISAPYIKKLNDAANQIYIRDLSKLTENIASLDKPALLDICKKIADYKNGCPDDLKKRYDGIVRRKIRDVEDKKVEAMCRGINGMTVAEILKLIDDIKAMDIDEEAKKHHVSDCENHILSIKKSERDSFTTRIGMNMADHAINQSFIVTMDSPTFESTALKMDNSFAHMGKFDLAVILHTVTQGNPDEGFLISLENVYCRNKNGLVSKISLNDVSKFIGKGGLFGNSLKVEEKNGSTTELPSNLKGKNIENVAAVLNTYLDSLNALKLAERQKAAEKKAAENNESFMNASAPKPAPAPIPEKKAVESSNEKAVSEQVKTEKAPEKVEVPVKTGVEKAESAKKSEDVIPVEIKPIKPIETAKAEPEVKVDIKPIKPIDIKPVENADQNISVDIKPIKPIDTAKSAETKPASAVSSPAPAAAQTTPAPAAAKAAAPAPTPAPASAKPIRMKFCDQCGAKIVSSTAKFCSECGNKIS